MPTENPFGAPLGEPPELPRLDAGSVIRRARRRRRARQVVVGGAAGLAVVAVVGVLGPNLVRVLPQSSSASSGASDSAAEPEFQSGGGKAATSPPTFACGSALPSTTSDSALTDLSVTLNLTGSRAAITLTSASSRSIALRNEEPLVVVGSAGSVASVYTVEHPTTPQSLNFSAGKSLELVGSLGSTTCPKQVVPATGGTAETLIVLPISVDGREEWAIVAPTEVSTR